MFHPLSMRRTHALLLNAIENAAERAERDSQTASTPGAEYAAKVGAATLRHLHGELEAAVQQSSPLRGGLIGRWGRPGAGP
jgi:hypothetical protein